MSEKEPLPCLRDAGRCAELVAAQEALRQHEAALPTCDEHKPDVGSRGHCVICALQKLSAAISRIDYAVGEPNDMECSIYDADQNEDAVVERVRALKEALRQEREAHAATKMFAEDTILNADRELQAERAAKHEERAARERAEAALHELAHWSTPDGDCWCDGKAGPIHSPGCRAARRYFEGEKETKE